MFQKSTVFAVAAVLGLSATPAAAQSGMDAFFENTVVMSTADGAEIRLIINSDNTYSGSAGDGATISGTWELVDGQTCFTRVEPEPLDPVCDNYADKAVGDSWEGTMADGTAVTMTLVEGR